MEKLFVEMDKLPRKPYYDNCLQYHRMPTYEAMVEFCHRNGQTPGQFIPWFDAWLSRQGR